MTVICVMDEAEIAQKIQRAEVEELLTFAATTPLSEVTLTSVRSLGLVPSSEPRNLRHVYDGNGHVDEAMEMGLIARGAPDGTCAYVRSKDELAKVFGESARAESFAVQYYGMPGG